MKKRALSLLMAVIMVVSLLPTAVWAADETVNEIRSDTDFYGMNASGSYILMSDITITAPYGSGSPLSNITKFTGTFDGNGHTITLNINSAGSHYQGAFAYIDAGGTVKNLITAGTIAAKNKNFIGGIAGMNCGTIEKCWNKTNITGKSNVGGIVGTNGTYSSSGAKIRATIKNCYNSGTINGTSSNIGGIVGSSTNSTLQKCASTGTISTTNAFRGGITGNSATSRDEISNCYWLASSCVGGKAFGTSYTEANSIINNLGRSEWQVDASGNLSLKFGPPEPGVSLSASSSSIQMKNSVSQLSSTLTAKPENMTAESVSWSIDPEGVIDLADTNDAYTKTATAVSPGTATVTVTVTSSNGETYTQTTDITVLPCFTTVELENEYGNSDLAAGQTVQAIVNVYNPGSYDAANDDRLTYKWYWYKSDAPTTKYPINDTTSRTCVIPTDFSNQTGFLYLYVEVYFNDSVAQNARGESLTGYHHFYYGDDALVSIDKTKLKIDTSDIKTEKTLTLPSEGSVNKSTITWESSHPDIIDPATGKVTLPESKTVVTLTATLKNGKNTFKKPFEITVWSKDQAQSAKDQLDADLTNALGEWYKLYPAYSADTTVNVKEMVEAKLNNPDISVSIKGVEKTNATDNSSNIADNGDVTFFYANPNNAPLQRFGTYSVTFTFTRDGITAERTVPVVVYWDQTQVKNTMTKEILDKVTLEGIATVEGAEQQPAPVTEDFDLPKVVDGKKWTLISWQSDDPAITISTEKQTTADTLFDPYVAVVRGGSAEKKVTLTANFTFQLANSSDETSALTLHKTFTVNVAPSADGEKYQDALNTVFDDDSLKDITGDSITSADGVYSVSGDIQFPITGDLNRYMLDKYGEDSGFDGKYTPVLITSSDPDVIKAPDVANAARVEVYRPAPGQDARTVTLTVRILDRPSGQGRNYDSMPVLAEKTFTFQVQPITTEEVRAELDLMQQVKEHYWDGIKNGNAYPQDVTSDLDPFVEVYQQDGKLVWVRDVKQMTNSGIVPVAMDGWQELEAWRLFQSSNPTAVSHENLLVTRQFEGKAVTITSALSSQTLGRYAKLYVDDPATYKDYATLAGLYYQTVSANLIVRGYNEANMTEETVTGSDGKSETIKVSTPKSETISVTFTLSGNGALWMDTTTLSDLPEGTTVYDVLQQLQREGKLTFQHKGGYVSSITFGDKTLTELEEGENSGWMYRVNGVLPDVYMSAYGLKNGDNIRVFFTTDYTKESGGHGGSAPSTVPTTPEQPTGLPFTDVQAGAWYADAVKYVFDQGLMSGMSAQEFGPDGQVTRGQVVTILWRLAGSPTVSGKAFPDVSASAWYADAVAWASANGVVSGYENGGFGPGDPVTREQLAAILYRYAQLSGKDTDQTADLSGYTDSVTISAWAPQALKWAVGSGLISGTGTHTLSPRGTATRAQIAVILQNFCK